MSDVEKLAKAVIGSRIAGMKPKDLLKAVRAKHPKASKKDISRAAFYAVIMMADTDPSAAAEVQSFALSARGEDDGEQTPLPKKRSGKKAGGRSHPTSS